MKRLTRQYIRKAEADRRAADILMRNPPSAHDAICFHCQQCAEKYLKALLSEQDVPIPYIHNLDRLLTLLLPFHPSLKSEMAGLKKLSRFAVDYRYPGHGANKTQSNASLRLAEKIRTPKKRRK